MNLNSEKQYIDLYNEARNLISCHSAQVMNAGRDKAFADFCKLGFPGKKNEKYKYTDIQSCFASDYGLNLNRIEMPVDPYKAFKCDVPNISTSLFFVLNDMFYTGKEQFAGMPDGVMIMGLKAAAEKYPDLVGKYYGKLASTENDGITAFNTAFVQDGVFLYIPDNVVLEKPVQLINVMTAKVDMMANRRILVVMGKNAGAKLLVCDHAESGVKYLSTQVAEIFVGENSVFDYYELEETCLSNIRLNNTYVEQASSSNVLMNGVTLTNGITRNSVNVSLTGENAEIMLNGIATVDKNQHIDNNTNIEHLVPRCSSRELFKYVLDDEAVGAFAGRVKVFPNAQKTFSQQTNKNLCLTRKAHMYTQPQLEIYADDVKCSHGATVGQLDEAAVFYMQQRGLSKKEAMTLLMFAFVNEVIDSIRMEPLKDRLHMLVEKRFRGELSRCSSCSKCK